MWGSYLYWTYNSLFLIQDNEAVENNHEGFNDNGVDSFDSVIAFSFVR